MTAIHLAIVTAADGADLEALATRLAERAAGCEGVADVLVAPSLKPNIDGGDLLWRTAFRDRAGWNAARPSLALDGMPGVAHVDWTAFEPIAEGRRAPTPAGGVYRQMTMHVAPAAPGTAVARFERETLGLADHVPQILRWTLGRVFAAGGARPWTHVWEQEFARVEDFTGPYMDHPWHWGLVDRWFDPEMPERIVDRHLCNSLCRLAAG